MRIYRETEVLGENLPRFYVVYHRYQMNWLGIKPRVAFMSKNCSIKICNRVDIKLHRFSVLAVEGNV
jgi:hypothetical protein